MKVTTRAEYQWDGHSYVLVSEDSYDYDGPVSLAKGSGGSSGIDPATLGMLTKQSADLNRTNTTGTYGSSDWTVDPTTGRYKQTVSLNPGEQSQLDTRNQISEQMLNNANGLTSQTDSPFDYGSSVSGASKAGFDRAISQLKPQWDQQNRQFDQSEADTGIPIGSEKYNKDLMNLQSGQNSQLYGTAQSTANADNSQSLSNNQQNYSDIANMLGMQNTQQPTAGTNAAIDTTGNFDKLNGNVAGMFNAANAQQSQGTAGLMALLGALL
jgi:hypothetical protein